MESANTGNDFNNWVWLKWEWEELDREKVIYDNVEHGYNEIIFHDRIWAISLEGEVFYLKRINWQPEFDLIYRDYIIAEWLMDDINDPPFEDAKSEIQSYIIRNWAQIMKIMIFVNEHKKQRG